MTLSDISAETRKDPDPTLPTLSPKRLAFVHCYADRDSETFGNATRSAMEAGYTQNYAAAATTASRLLKNPKVQEYVKRLMEDIEAGIQVRVIRLVEIALGRENVRTETIQEDQNGKMLGRTVTISGVAAGIRLKALRELNILAGDR